MRAVCFSAPLWLLVASIAQAQSPAPAVPPTASASSPSTAGVRAPRVEVQFTTTEPGVTVYSRPVPPTRLTGPEGGGEPSEFKAVCQAPCAAALEPTLHEFALAPAGGAPIPAVPAFELKSNAQFRTEIVSHESVRRTGWWILGIMGTVGITSTTIGMLQTCVDDQTCQEWTSLAIWSGFAVTAAGALLGLPKIATHDEATITLVPGTAALTDPSAARLPASDRASAVSGGASLVGRF
jgi:hypothetical protein